VGVVPKGQTGVEVKSRKVGKGMYLLHSEIVDVLLV
jgi:hypothetical protein